MSVHVRRLLSPRAVGLGAIALVLMAGMIALGLWQLGVYDDRQHDDVVAQLASQPKPLNDVLGPDDAFPGSGVSQPVTASGHYVAGEQFEVRDGSILGVHNAVVSPLQLDDGAVILVVRGQGSGGAAPPTGPVDVTGVLEPSDPVGSALDARRTTDGLRIAALVQDFDQDLYSGYVVLTASDPADALRPVPPPLPDASRWAGVRNLLYAIQWWIFAGFVGFMWWRIVTEPPDEQPAGSGAAGVDVQDETAAHPSRSVG